MISKKRKSSKKWTFEEDQLLREAVTLFGINDWEMVEKHVGHGRNKAQCSQRWTRDIDPQIKREKWTSFEDKILLDLVEIYGVKSWTKISKEIKTRNDAQCRFRYYNKLHEESNLTKKINEVFQKIADPINCIPFSYFSWDDDLFQDIFEELNVKKFESS